MSQELEFPQLCIILHVLERGEPNGLYHAEAEQEAFLDRMRRREVHLARGGVEPAR